MKDLKTKMNSLENSTAALENRVGEVKVRGRELLILQYLQISKGTNLIIMK